MIYLIFFYLIIPIQFSVALVEQSFMQLDPQGSWKCPLPDEVTCNDHIPERKCVCYKRSSDMTAPSYPYCGEIIKLNNPFGLVVTLSLNFSRRNWFKCEYSRVIGSNYRYQSMDEALTTNIESCGNFESKSVVVLRKNCVNEKFQVQVAILNADQEHFRNLTDEHFTNFYKYHLLRFLGRSTIVKDSENADRLFPLIDNTPTIHYKPSIEQAPSHQSASCFSLVNLNFLPCANAHYIFYCTLAICIFVLACAVVYYDRIMSRYEKKKIIQVVPNLRINGFEKAETGTSQALL